MFLDLIWILDFIFIDTEKAAAGGSFFARSLGLSQNSESASQLTSTSLLMIHHLRHHKAIKAARGVKSRQTT